MQRKLTTILAADVVGCSRLASADEEGTVSRLRALRQELVDPLVTANGGRVFKETGDGRLAEFASVVGAVRCALNVQRAMIARNANIAPDKRIEFRVGIHLGDVIVLMGDGVNIAARLEVFVIQAGFVFPKTPIVKCGTDWTRHSTTSVTLS
jgi:adenylate cyclase